MPFLDHLEELRWRIIKSLAAVIIGAIFVFIFIDQIIDILITPAKKASIPPNFQVLTVHGMFMLKWGISLVGGMVTALPVITYHLWKFIVPGLLDNEKRYTLPVIVITFLSFICGVFFAYFVIIPYSINFFTSIGYIGVENNYSINQYFNFVLWILISAGILFELPVLVMVLSSIGLVTPPFMRHYRRHSFVIFFIISAFLTPPDPVSLLIMTFPLILLYELSIWISRLFWKEN